MPPTALLQPPGRRDVERGRQQRHDPHSSFAQDSDRSLAVVAARLPVAFDTVEGWTRAPGGLVSALEPVMRNSRTTWFGLLDRGDPFPSTTAAGCVLAPVVVDESDRRLALDGLCNQTLWPALHGLTERIVQHEQWWDRYQDLNRCTAEVVARRTGADSFIWVHDYHFFGFAAAFRKIRPAARIGLFCHTPIVASSLRSLEHSQELANALCSFDLIGCQTGGDCDDMEDLVGGATRRRPTIVTDPVGFDVEQWRSFRRDVDVVERARVWQNPSGVLAVGVDRVDHSKGLMCKLLAVELLLEREALSADEFRLVQIATPSRTHVAAYRHLDTTINATAARINATFARSDGRPVVELIRRQLAPVEVAGLMRAADLALVTPVRDGMNLVALEFSVLNADRSAGVVLGRGAGAADVIGEWCDLVDGDDVNAVAQTIVTTVARLHDTASVDRSRRRGQAAAALTSQRWAATFLDRLAPSTDPAPTASTTTLLGRSLTPTVR